MVVFTCQHCNEALKRTAVVKHYATRCRNDPHLTCIDCLKDFSGDDYNNHNTCITEDERYGDQNYKAKPTAVKQMAWIDIVHSCAKENENPKYKVLFSKLVTYENVPRKRNKFLNFIKSSMPGFSPEISSEVFRVIENEFKNQKNITSKGENDDSKGEENCNESSNVKVENDTDRNEKKKKKKKSIENGETCEVVPKFVNEEIVIKKKKKSKKLSKLSSEDIDAVKSADIGNIFNINHASENDVQTNGFFRATSEEFEGKENIQDNQNNIEENNLESENKEKLSKKELKKLKKKQKYEAELKDIEESMNVDCTTESNNDKIEHNDNDLTKALKKRKKRKGAVSESEADVGKRLKVEDAEETENCPNDEKEEVQLEEKQNKGNIKFNWEEVIKEVLKKSSDQEMSIKRISKKVIAEYQTVKGNRESYEQLFSKFNKKINKTVGVRVLKDRAKLISDE